MTLVVEKSPQYKADIAHQFGWYCEKVDEPLAWRFFNATDDTLIKLARQPDLGSRRRFRHPMLQELYSFQVNQPFQKLLIFYRVNGNTLQAWRLMHGSRDLPNRLTEPAETI